LLRHAYEALLEAWPGDHLVSTFPGGERLRVAATWRHITWNPHEYAAFRAATRPGDVVLDVGANVGAYSLLFALWAGPSGRVFAFEPGSAARAGLEAHVRRNHLPVTICPLAVSDVVGRAAFTTDAPSGANALATVTTGRTEEVATTTIDAFCLERGIQPDVIKIDVEGAELQVLRGARRVIAHPGVRVFVEFHPSTWLRSGLRPEDLQAELDRQGLTPEALAPDLDPWRTEGVSVRLRRR
jgi:FkbM family methyltransferase